jgi:hypothetical protein
MNFIWKSWVGFCWLMIGLFMMGILGQVLMYFEDPDFTLILLISMVVVQVLLAYLFYFLGPKKNKDKLKLISQRFHDENKETDLIQELLEMIEKNDHHTLVQKKLINFKYMDKSDDLVQIKRYISENKTIEKNKLTAFKQAKKDELERVKSEKRYALLEKKEAARNEILKKLKTLCIHDKEWSSFKRGMLCIGMHIKLVRDLKGQKYDEKRNITEDKQVFKYKYGRSKNQRDNWSYSLEVTFENDRVTSFKDL